MMLYKKILSIITLSFLLLQQNSAQQFVKAKDKKIITSSGENLLLRGFGLGGWMLQEGYMLRIYNDAQQYRIRERIDSLIGKEKTREFYDTWIANHTTKADIDSLKSWGFNSVRLPMHYNLYTLPADQEPVKGQNTWLEKGFKMTDDLVAWCKANKLYLILDLHAAPGGQGNDLNIADRDPSKPSLWESREAQLKTIALWKKLAERYHNEPIIAAYDILNEPNWGFTDPKNDRNGTGEKNNEPIEKLFREITTAIRSVDKNHLIIIEGNGWGNNYNGMFKNGLWDNNMALSFHKYWNFNDTKSINNILKYRDNLNVPVWLGETGENSNVWFRDAIKLLEDNNIGWAWWPWKKLGNNNPLQVPFDEAYSQLTDYWNGRSTTAPNAAEAYKTLIQLAKNTNIKNNILHRDVIDAMIRQPHSNETLPFKNNPIQSGATINAVDYDLGRNGFAYYDKDTANYRVSGQPGAGNKGNVYRNDGVDIFKDKTGNDYYVGDIENGEWLQYTINVKKPGTYNIGFRLAAEKEGGLLQLENNKGTVYDRIAVTPTGSSDDWKNFELKNIKLSTGKKVLRVRVIGGGFNFKSFSFKQ